MMAGGHAVVAVAGDAVAGVFGVLLLGGLASNSGSGASDGDCFSTFTSDISTLAACASEACVGAGCVFTSWATYSPSSTSEAQRVNVSVQCCIVRWPGPWLLI